MEERYEVRYSENLGREMGHAVFGHAGKLCLAFAPQNGHIWDFRNFGMVDTVKPWIDAGKLRIICVDSIDEESWSDTDGDPRHRAEMQEKWFHYIVDELIPEHLTYGEKAMTTGCSMGGLHSAWNTGLKEEDVTFRYENDGKAQQKTGDILFDNETRLGIYLGAGVDIGHIRVSTLWKKAGSNSSGLNEKGCGILTVAYLLKNNK